MKKQLLAFPIERVENLILVIRGEKVILDADLAKLYGVSTKALNQAVRRNRSRFPADFLFPLTAKEKEKVVTNCDHLRKLKFSRTLPNAFTEHGAIMAANVLNSERAVEAGLQVVRAFVKLRQMLASNANLARKLNDLEKRYDHQFKIVFEAIRQLMAPSASNPKQIGFRSRALKK